MDNQNENLVTLDVAEQEINKWLDHKRIREKKREAQKDNIETLVAAVADGDLVYDEESHQLVQTLLCDYGNEVPFRELRYDARLNMGKVRKNLKGVKITDDSLGYIMAYISTLTNKPKAMIDALDSDDYKIGQAIAGFFI
jgi:hypothetical protein